jgi:hypothetical protein
MLGIGREGTLGAFQESSSSYGSLQCQSQPEICVELVFLYDTKYTSVRFDVSEVTLTTKDVAKKT